MLSDAYHTLGGMNEDGGRWTMDDEPSTVALSIVDTGVLSFDVNDVQDLYNGCIPFSHMLTCADIQSFICAIFGIFFQLEKNDADDGRWTME